MLCKLDLQGINLSYFFNYFAEGIISENSKDRDAFV